jgi:hypothetical protein
MATETAMVGRHQAWRARRAPHLDAASVQRVERFWAAVGLERDDPTDARVAHGVAYMLERWTGTPGRAAWVGRALFEFLRPGPTLAAWLDANAALTEGGDDDGDKGDALARIAALEAERAERKGRLKAWEASLLFTEVESALREWARCLLSPRTVSLAVSRSRRVLTHFNACTDGQTIWLPDRVDSAMSTLESRGIYLGLLAHEAAHIRADSFALNRRSPAADALWRRLADRVGLYGRRGGRRSGPEVGGVERFARCFSTERLAEFILRLFEDARVDAWVRRHWQPLWPLLFGVRSLSRRDQPAPPVLRPREAILHALTEDALGLPAHYRVPAAWVGARTEVAAIAARLRDAAYATAIDAAGAAADALDVLQRHASIADMERLDRAAGRALDVMPAVPAAVEWENEPKKVPEIYASELGGELDIDFGSTDGPDLIGADAVYDEVDLFRGEMARAAVTCVPLRAATERHPDSGRMDLPPPRGVSGVPAPRAGGRRPDAHRARARSDRRLRCDGGAPFGPGRGSERLSRTGRGPPAPPHRPPGWLGVDGHSAGRRRRAHRPRDHLARLPHPGARQTRGRCRGVAGGATPAAIRSPTMWSTRRGHRRTSQGSKTVEPCKQAASGSARC